MGLLVNKETLDMYKEYLNQYRQTGKRSSQEILDWRNLFDKYFKVQDRKEKIKRIFNI